LKLQFLAVACSVSVVFNTAALQLERCYSFVVTGW
jgi:hypothetical protein